tara:strand:+ start:1642 stop:1767 length:126 start_codon:yes stop_codon:yes gene_type:complete
VKVLRRRWPAGLLLHLVDVQRGGDDAADGGDHLVLMSDSIG